MWQRVNASELKEFALSVGLQSVGVCRPIAPPHYDAYRKWLEKGYHGEMSYLRNHLLLKQDPQHLLPGAQSIIACTLNYGQPAPSQKGNVRIARYALGRDYHKVLRSKLGKLASWIQKNYPDSKCRPCVDSAPIMERDYAQHAGLGFFGKNTMLIDSKRGSWFFIGLLLTTVSFEVDTPAVGGCGSCRKCIDACPTGAIVFEDQRWQLDARKCISYLTIEKRGEIDPTLSAQMGDWTFGCDVCQDVCPFNENRESQPLRSPVAAEKDFEARPLIRLKDLVEMDRADWDEWTRGSAIRRAGFDGIKRNAQINLENLATSESDSA